MSKDLCMRGNDENSSSAISEFDHGQAPPTSYNNTRVRTASTEDKVFDSNAELILLIEELNKYATIRKTHTRIKIIATRLAEILSDLRNAEHRAHSPLNMPTNIPSETQEVIRQYESIMAELLRISGTQNKATTDGNVRKLIAELADHWGAVGTAVRLAVHPHTTRSLP